MGDPKQQWTAADMIDMLRALYPANAYALLSQVRNATGFGLTARTADAIAMSLWPSRGLVISGFEIKVSRSDWRRELRAPEKADEIAKRCDEWWVVAPAGVVPRDELPPTWGLLEAGETRLSVARMAAVKLQTGVIDRDFLAALLRRVQAQPEEEIEARVRERLTKHAEDERESRELDAQALEKALVATMRAAEWQGRAERAQQAITAFEAKSGVRLTEWAAGDIGAAVRAVLAGGDWRMREALAALTKQAEAFVRLSAEITAPPAAAADERIKEASHG